MTEGDLNPTTPQELTRLRGRLLGLLEDLSNETNDDLRLRAILGGLRALAQIESLKIRQQRADQNERALTLAERHLALNERKFERTKLSSSPQPRSGETAVAPGVCPGFASSSSGAPEGRHNPASTNDQDPLTNDEVAELKSLLPEIPTLLFRQKIVAHKWRDILRDARANPPEPEDPPEAQRAASPLPPAQAGGKPPPPPSPNGATVNDGACGLSRAHAQTPAPTTSAPSTPRTPADLIARMGAPPTRPP